MCLQQSVNCRVRVKKRAILHTNDSTHRRDVEAKQTAANNGDGCNDVNISHGIHRCFTLRSSSCNARWDTETKRKKTNLARTVRVIPRTRTHGYTALLPTSTHPSKRSFAIPVLLAQVLHNSSVDLRVGAPCGLSAVVPRGFLGHL